VRGWQLWRRTWWCRPALYLGWAVAPLLVLGGWMLSSAHHDLEAARAPVCSSAGAECVRPFAGRLSGPYVHPSGLGWVIRPVDGSHGVGFQTGHLHTGRLYGARGQVVTAFVYGNEVARVRLPDSSQVIPQDVGLRGASLDVSLGGLAMLFGVMVAAESALAARITGSWWTISPRVGAASLPRRLGWPLGLLVAAVMISGVLLLEGMPLVICWVTAAVVPLLVVGVVVVPRHRSSPGVHVAQ
jgi:hypothetical protein